MTFSITIFLLTVLTLGVYAFFSLRRDGWRRYVGPLGFIVIIGFSLFGFSQTLGGCIPEWATWGTKMDIISIAYDEPRFIYLWGVDGDQPKCVALPWSEERAKKIRGEENETTDGGIPLEYQAPNGLESEGVLHPKPQEALPPKDLNGAIMDLNQSIKELDKALTERY
jgi:hypothetical protein